jgi:formylglycine-generating enzyme required for sulfatase activity
VVDSAGEAAALDSAIEAGAREIESVLPSGSKVAVLYFSSPSEALSNYVIEELMGYMVRDRKVVVVDRNSLDIIRREQNFQLSGEVDDNSAQAIGKMLGAQSVVAGSLVDLGGTYRFRVYTLNVETAAREAAYMSTIRPDAQITHLLNTRNTPSVASNQAPLPVAVTQNQAPQLPPVPDNMVLVEGGTFEMGSANGLDNETPVHQVRISSFYMSKYEVTQQEYQAVMGINPSYFKGDNLPVETVSWYEAIEYCNKLSVKEGLTPAYRGSGDSVVCDLKASGYRLPTEAEWEYAAKGGSRETMVYEYSGSNSVDAVGWHRGNSGETTHPVGGKVPNSLGLYDMSGNVWEWCWDWYGDYGSGAQTDPVGAVSGALRVRRGGSWFGYGWYARSAYRYYFTPSSRYGNLGFRLVRP